MQPCPRQVHEATLPSQRTHASHWRDDGTCSYCGSLHPEALLGAIEGGTALLGGTDKNYVDLPNPTPDAPVIGMSTNMQLTPEQASAQGYLPADDAARRTWGLSPHTTFYKLSTQGPYLHRKFYLQHFDAGQQQRFVDLYNAKRLQFRNGDGLYVIPFFMKRVS
jgi:hypothetical protein